ncbi:MAG: hypothetical protein ACRDH6_07505 [Actinomycetota bacterium]
MSKTRANKGGSTSGPSRSGRSSRSRGRRGIGPWGWWAPLVGLVVGGMVFLALREPGDRSGEDPFVGGDLHSLVADPSNPTLFAGARDRMLDLRTLRVEETLSSGRATVRVTYAFQAPDRMAIDADAGFQSILVGGFRYRRDGPDDPWMKERALTPAKVPLFIWDAQLIVAPRMLGEEQVQGRATMVVSFFGPAGETPIWHRLWVNPSGLVLQAEMRAQGHFMHHRYDAFDSDLRIEAPEGAP